MSHHHHTEELEGVAFWESHYGQSERVWSGKVNQVIENLVKPLTPGTSLDTGCGEGGDVLWLASHGWQATGLDISPTAISRARDEAKRHEIPADLAQFVASDLGQWDTDKTFDLVTLSFFQAPFEFPRADFLRKAASFVAPDGHLLILSHAARPSWAPPVDHAMPAFPSPEQDLEALALDLEDWTILQAEVLERNITAPTGEPAVMKDSVVFVQRTA
ncbi:class I SAM-dependent methyltransferase [Glutamicibacter ectropisis]|uniref:Class I SAM-dependent methyltransferase n=1 Tax=Glutamicibacter ectropisis TaxID=3046593 RepID=A0AAU6WE90_9MICC